MSQTTEERWIEFEACTIDDDDKVPNFDIFSDPDPYQTFSFQFQVPLTVPLPVPNDIHIAIADDSKSTTTSITETTAIKATHTIDITLKGFKHEHERIFDSTGLTLWRASKLLCNFMCAHPEYIQNKSVLELGAGLGLCGLLAYHLQASYVVMTDGDTDVLAEMRLNVDQNLSNYINVDTTETLIAEGRKTQSAETLIAEERKTQSTETQTAETQTAKTTLLLSKDILPCRQLLWGKKYIQPFKQSIIQQYNNTIDGSFDVIIASDIIYVDYILDDLFDTVVGMLSQTTTKTTSKFLLAYARRAVDINAVFECATKHGLVWIEPEETEGVYIFSLQAP